MSRFGTNLKNLREQKGITQEALAQAINIKRVSISGYETGRKEPSYDTLIMIADFLEVGIDELLGRNININSNNLFNLRLYHEERQILHLLHNRPLLKSIFQQLAYLSDGVLDSLNNFISALSHEHYK